MMTQPANIIEELRTPEKVVTIVQTSEEVEYVAEEEPPAPAMHLYGNCRITFYCPCSAWRVMGQRHGLRSDASVESYSGMR